MWNKIVIGVTTLCFLNGCGNAVGDSEKQYVETQIEKANRVEFDNLVGTQGALPNIAPPASIAALQTRTAARLKKGLGSTYFPDTVPAPSEMLRELVNPGQANGWVMVDSNRRLYLVKRHLQAVPKNNVGQEFSEFCNDGKLYSGYVAARPFTEQTIQAEALQEVTANPYGLLVCDQTGALKLKLLDANHPILKT